MSGRGPYKKKPEREHERKPTDLPWRISGDADNDTLWLEGPAPEYRLICHFGRETPRRRADAELILRALVALGAAR